MTADGVRWLRRTSGAGRLGAQTEWWSVDWSEVRCDDACDHVYNGHRRETKYDAFRSNLLTMREGEVRRLWVPRHDKDGFWVVDVRLYEVYDTASDGGPLIPPVPAPRFPRQLYEHR